MQKLSTIVLMSSFIAIAVFGVFAIDHNKHHGQSRCLAETAARTDCPENNIFAVANFLLNVFKSFSTAHLISGLFLILFLIASRAFFNGFTVPITNNTQQSPSREQISRALSAPLKLQFARTLALREKRDPARSL